MPMIERGPGAVHSGRVERTREEDQPMSTAPAPTCAVVRVGETFDGKQGLSYFAGISAESVGAKGICMHMVTFPPGARAKAHLHADHETAIYVLSGEAEMWYGEGLRERLTMRAGEFVYIPAGMPQDRKSV